MVYNCRWVRVSLVHVCVLDQKMCVGQISRYVWLRLAGVCGLD